MRVPGLSAVDRRWPAALSGSGRGRRTQGAAPHGPSAAQRTGPSGISARARTFCFLTAVVLATCAAVAATDGASHSYYTEAQATAGQAVFAQQCAICHGDHMEGKVGPALAGNQFLSVSQYQELTADYLYRFMAKQMPANAPGSLSQTQYLDVLAYILEVNGYPAGPRQLTANDSELTQIKIGPMGEPQHKSETEDRR
jgi:mono/diheme cytochrome c family protein